MKRLRYGRRGGALLAPRGDCLVIRIDLQLAHKKEWAEILDRREQAIFVRHDDPPAVGETVRVDLTVGAGGPRVILRGEVVTRQQPASGLPGGFKLALGPYEREKVSYLSGFVRGGLLDLREMRRLPIRLAVRFRSAVRQGAGHTRDLNEAGLFIVDPSPLPEDTRVELELDFPGADEPLALEGVVSHTVVLEDEDVPGMGVRFEIDDRARAKLAAVVDELERRFMAGDLPDDALL
jgi:uncharacterized protein (TIGR02266 family)